MRPEIPRRSAPLVVMLAAVVLLLPRPAAAFPWMIHHGYTQCAQCHIDPSGAGVLTDYGRAQGEILLRTQYGEPNPAPETFASFLFGAVDLPEGMQVQPDVRALVIPEPGNIELIVMQADLRLGYSGGPWSASAAIGGVSDGAELAWLSSNEGGWNLVSREYWLGYTPTRSLTLRAGRMNLPFGIRTEDHILYVRSATATTTNDDQQLGLAATWTQKRLRAEVMGIAGNLQVSPDDFRKRGYSAYAALMPNKTLEIGASSLFTTSQLDVETLEPRTFLAEGLFVRAAPIPELAILAEADLMFDRAGEGEDWVRGWVGTGILDYEPLQGLHVQGLGDVCSPDLSGPSGADRTIWNAGGAVQWFFAPRADLRLDAAYGSLFCTAGASASPYGLVQAHLYL